MSEAGQILDAAAAPSTSSAPGTTQQAGGTPTSKEEAISPKLAVLMERERQAVTRERLAKTQEEKLRDKLLKLEEFETLQKDPNKIEDLLKSLGWDYNKLTESKLQDGEVPPSVLIQQLNDKISDLENRLKQDKSQEAEEKKKHAQEAESRAVNDFKTEIQKELKANAGRYELIEFEQAGELVYDVIDEHYNRTLDPQTGVGQVMPISEAADKVEEHLEKKYLAAKEKSKVKAFWANGPKNLAAQIKQMQKPEDRQPPKTLTNNMGPKTLERQTRPPEDRRIQDIVSRFMASRQAQVI